MGTEHLSSYQRGMHFVNTQQTYFPKESKLWAHLWLDLPIGCLHNDLLPGSGGGSSVLLHGFSLARQSLETKKHVQY